MNRINSTYCLSTSNATFSGTLVGTNFTGKEKDFESGYHYFGARYYDSEVLTGWLSVDPMSDKYPSILPYAYCAWNRPTGGHEHRLIKSNLVNNPVMSCTEKVDTSSIQLSFKPNESPSYPSPTHNHSKSRTTR